MTCSPDAVLTCKWGDRQQTWHSSWRHWRCRGQLRLQGMPHRGPSCAQSNLQICLQWGSPEASRSLWRSREASGGVDCRTQGWTWVWYAVKICQLLHLLMKCKPCRQCLWIEVLCIDEISVTWCLVGAKVASNTSSAGVQNWVNIARVMRITIVEEFLSIVLVGHGKSEEVWVNL